MPVIRIRQRIRVYEIDGNEAPWGAEMGIDSHEDNGKMVLLVIEGKSYTVFGHSLLTAVANALNSGD